MKAVFNSSPLIFLSKLNVLDKVGSLFSKIIIPDLVLEEISHKEDITLDKVKSLLDLDHVFVTNANNSKMVKVLCEKLGKGESEAIVLALDNTFDIVILDDYPARQEALRTGLNVKGTLGIMKRMLDSEMIQYDFDKLYQDLVAMNFRVKRNIFDQIFDITI